MGISGSLWNKAVLVAAKRCELLWVQRVFDLISAYSAATSSSATSPFPFLMPQFPLSLSIRTRRSFLPPLPRIQLTLLTSLSVPRTQSLSSGFLQWLLTGLPFLQSVYPQPRPCVFLAELFRSQLTARPEPSSFSVGWSRSFNLRPLGAAGTGPLKCCVPCRKLSFVRVTKGP